MYRIRTFLLSMLLFTLMLTPGTGRADETDIFSFLSPQPDVLLLLDQTGSMTLLPYASMKSGGDPYYFWCDPNLGNCTEHYSAQFTQYYTYKPTDDYERIDVMRWGGSADYPKYSTSDCAGPFYIAPIDRRGAGLGDYRTDCSKLAVMKRAVFSILDANGNGTVQSNPPGGMSPDQTTLGVRLGYEKYYNCGGPSDFNSCIQIVDDINTDYSAIWNHVNAADAMNNTPMNAALAKAKVALDAHRDCRQKFVILITDGQDNLSCDGSGESPYSRMGSVQAAKQLADAGYKVFVIGFGSTMPQDMKNTLNWMAYYGGTDNSLVANTGNLSAITIDSTTDYCHGGSTNDPNDPGPQSLGGYAYTAENEATLKQDLKDAFDAIKIIAARYSFSMASVAAGRISDQNFLFQASFEPNKTTFWRGHLREYTIKDDGTFDSTVLDAGTILNGAPSPRNIFTYLDGVYMKFAPPPDLSWGTIKGYLGVDTDPAKAIVGYIQGDPAYNSNGWKLGDIFHSNPITIGTPSSYFIDVLAPSAFNTFRDSNKARAKIIVAGANDGQFHAFLVNGMVEKWSFIPPNLLPKLQYLALPSNSATPNPHTYFVDGPVTAADVWLGSGDGKSKNPNEWTTLLVFSEGRGVWDYTNTTSTYLWSSSPNCDKNFNGTYSNTYSYYCGYWAFDVTHTGADTPTYKWRLNPTATQAPYLAEPWSKMAIGRVKISGNERWVGFIGGGYTNDGDQNRGKGFFVVDLHNGNILWSFTRGDSSGMAFNIPASPAVADTDNDGFVDTAYIGDLGGNIWRFKFCTNDQGDTCGTGNWTGGNLFQPSSAMPIYNTPVVSRDSGGSLWVFWGTGDESHPTLSSTNDAFFGVLDTSRAHSYSLADLKNISGTVFTGTDTNGWYINLARGEKVLADAAVFAGVLAWTTYNPTASSDPCNGGGTARLYAIAMMPLAINGVTYQAGAGLFSEDGTIRYTEKGSGIPETPVFSQKPAGVTGGTDLYTGTSGGGGADTSIIGTKDLPDSPLSKLLQSTGPSSHLLHWWDQRVQQP